jgi:TPR repeat protein
MARRLFERAVQQGDMDAMYELGFMYEDGLGVELSHERAFEYYKQAAHLGHRRSQFNLGTMYRDGEGVLQSYQMAKQLYTLAIKHGSTDAMINLGCLYANGDLGDKRDQINMIKARDLLTKAVALGDNRAIEFLEELNDDERETAALDPNAILCSFCGLPETETRNFSKTKCPCKSTWYCNTTCQKKHWKEHRTECKRLIAKFKRKKKIQVPQNERIPNTKMANIDGAVTTSMSNGDTVDSLLKKMKEEEGDECPICLELLPKDDMTFTRWQCCGNGLHHHCHADLKSMKMGDNCPLCRAKSPTTMGEVVKQLHPWVKKKKAWAQASMGDMYKRGHGVEQSYEMARRLYELAAQQGDVSSMANLALMYYKGDGVEQSYERAKEYFEQAAHLGHAEAQYHLGSIHFFGKGVETDEVRGNALFVAAAAQGNEAAIRLLDILHH